MHSDCYNFRFRVLMRLGDRCMIFGCGTLIILEMIISPCEFVKSDVVLGLFSLLDSASSLLIDMLPNIVFVGYLMGQQDRTI